MEDNTEAIMIQIDSSIINIHEPKTLTLNLT